MLTVCSRGLHSFFTVPTTMYLVVDIPIFQIGCYPSYCLSCYNEGAIGLAYRPLDIYVRVSVCRPALIRSVRFTQVELFVRVKYPVD